MRDYSLISNQNERFEKIEKDWCNFDRYISDQYLDESDIENAESIKNGRDYDNAIKILNNRIDTAEALMDRKTCNWYLFEIPEYIRKTLLFKLKLKVSSKFKVGEIFNLNFEDFKSGKFILSKFGATIKDGARVKVIFPGLVAIDCMEPESGKKYPSVFPAIIEEVENG